MLESARDMAEYLTKFQSLTPNTTLCDGKILTIAVPAYNAAHFLPRTLGSFMNLSEKYRKMLEVIIVNDGSKDNTADVALEYVTKFPEMFVLVNKENGGHGSGVNYGMQHGRGLYYYVLDADDWLEQASLEKVLDFLEAQLADYTTNKASKLVDLLLVDYTYENIEEGKNRISLKRQVPVKRFFNFTETKYFTQGTYLTMHSMIYRMDILAQAQLVLPEHCFYVDNLIAYIPLPYCHNFYYLPLELYHYEVGRDDQSVNEQNFIKRIDQQIKVTKLLTEAFHLYDDLPGDTYKCLRRYLLHYLAAMYTVSIVHLRIIANAEAKDKISALWQFLQHFDKRMYRAVRRSLANSLLTLPFTDKTVTMIYHVVKKVLKFN